MKGHTIDKPKIMLEVDGVSLLQRLTDNLSKNGISNINIVVGYKKELFRDFNRFNYFENTDYRNNNILHSLFYAEDAMDSGFFFSYSDILFDDVIVKQMVSSESDIAIAVDPDWIGYYDGREEHPIAEAELVFSKDGRNTTHIGKNSDHQNALGEFLGVAKFSKNGARILKSVFKELEKHYSDNPSKPFQKAPEFKKAYLTDMFQELIDRGVSIEIVKIKGRWAEIDTPRDLRVADQMWRK
ncbi:MAG: phosphocholine cytidylyltransferase family protein [Proteobacteria bacterium]|nr:phosphocholine cytidylyltransferase family protein [Pseudomonadota bacterium]